MKKTVLSLLFICSTLAMSAAGIHPSAKGEEIDTLSYITGQQVGHSIKDQVIPQLKLDYDIIVSTIDICYPKEKSVKVNGIVITPENIQEIAPKYFNQELQQKVMAAMNDSTKEVFAPADKKIVSTLVGADFAYNLKKAPYPIEKKSFMKGLKDTHDNKEKLTLEQANAFMERYYTVVIPEKNRKESAEWLAKVEKEKGVKKTASGILYRIEIEGDMNAKAIKDEDVVKVIYTGKTKDGKVFDSNRWTDMPKERQEMTKQYQPDQAGKDNPIEFPLNRVIKGWTEGMKLVGKGGKITLWIPAELAYGTQGAGNDIGPNEALRFDIELIEVKSK